MAFDPNAATARYIDSLGPAALQKAHDYTVGKEWMLLWGLVVAAIVTWLIVRSGVLDRLDAQDRRAAPQPARLRRRARLLPRLAHADPAVDDLRRAGGARRATAAPASRSATSSARRRSRLVISSYRRGLVHDRRLLADAPRAASAGGCGRAALTAVVLAFVILLSPILIEPLFNKYEPVPPGQVRDAVVEMAGRAGIPPEQGLHVQRLAPVEQFHCQCRRRRQHGAGRDLRRRVQECLARRSPGGHRPRDRPLCAQAHLVRHPVLLARSRSSCSGSPIAAFPRFARAFGSNAAIAEPRGVPVLMFMVVAVRLAGAAAVQQLQPDDRNPGRPLFAARPRTGPMRLSTALVKTAEYRYPRPSAVEEVDLLRSSVGRAAGADGDGVEGRASRAAGVDRPQKKPARKRALMLVAGAGFEPATFRL